MYPCISVISFTCLISLNFLFRAHLRVSPSHFSVAKSGKKEKEKEKKQKKIKIKLKISEKKATALIRIAISFSTVSHMYKKPKKLKKLKKLKIKK